MEASQVNLSSLVNNLGSRRERTGQTERAIYIISFESYLVNTGDVMKDAKEGGK
jgi:hypothetical protein